MSNNTDDIEQLVTRIKEYGTKAHSAAKKKNHDRAEQLQKAATDYLEVLKQLTKEELELKG